MAGEDNTAGRQRQRGRAVAGSALILLLTGIALLTFFLDDLIDAFRADYMIHAVIDGAALPEGAAVWVNGRPTGTVVSVGLLPGGTDTLPRIVLALLLPASARSQVRGDSHVRITSENMTTMMSARAIDIANGTLAAPPLAPGDTLRQERAITRAGIAAQSAMIGRELDATMVQVRAQSRAVSLRLDETRHVFAYLDTVVAEIDRLRVDVADGPGLAPLRDPAFTASLGSLRSHARELGMVIGSMRERAGETSDAREALALLMVRADSLRTSLAVVSAALDDPNASFSRFRQDSALARAIDAVRAELDMLIADVKENPLKFVF